MTNGETIRYYIEKELCRNGLTDWCDYNGIDMVQLENFLEAGEKAIDEQNVKENNNDREKKNGVEDRR